ncbi:hypothetical protein [Photobacterium minamisatsumaniensis]|uniref:hypothetical protein n=1 Tax=Photobacterium minamisatsumaniensis TaxID=2910233 RepID=UPI003D09C9B1
MLVLRLLPVVISFWLLAAHYLRFSNIGMLLILACLPLLLFYRSSYTPKLVTVLLVIVAAQWLMITYEMVSLRLMMGNDWIRLLCIMGGVVCFTLMSACCFQAEKVSHFYKKLTL